MKGGQGEETEWSEGNGRGWERVMVEGGRWERVMGREGGVDHRR